MGKYLYHNLDDFTRKWEDSRILSVIVNYLEKFEGTFSFGDFLNPFLEDPYLPL